MMFNLFIKIIILISLSSAQIMEAPSVSREDSFSLINFNLEAEELNLAANKALVISSDSRAVFYKKEADTIQAIASITKLMTALVFLDNNPGWEKTYTIKREDNVEGGRLHLFLGEEVYIRDLLATSLVASDNGATQALVHASGLSMEEFVAAMNEKAKKLSLFKTNFVDPIGLSDYNVSTAKEVALLAKEALNNPEISKLTQQKEYQFKTLNGRDKKIESTNYLLFSENGNDFSILGSKTGYTEEAGYCFVGRFQNPDGREVISVVLGSDGKNERFKESRVLINWVFNNYSWKIS